MADEQILSPDERDALTEAAADESPTPEGEPRVYDLTSHDRIVRGRLPTLELIVERYANLLRTNLIGFLGPGVEITNSDVTFKKFEEYINSIPTPCSMHVFRANPLRGSAVLSFAPEFVFLMVDKFFGGVGDATRRFLRGEFSSTELQISRDFADKALADFDTAWTTVTPISTEWVKAETNPRFLHIADENEPVVDCMFEVEAYDNTFQVHFVIQDNSLDPVREELGASGSSSLEFDQRWFDSIKNDVGDARIDLTAIVGRCPLTVSDLTNAKVGDVLPMEMHTPVPVRAGPITLFSGSFGVNDGQYAIRLDQPVTRSVNLTPDLPEDSGS